MSTMVTEIYDALREADASEGKAQAAARAVPDYDAFFGKIEADLLVLRWVAGFVLAGVVSLMLKVFFMQ